MPKPTRSRFDFRCVSPECGHVFSLELTRAEFIDNDHLCPECESTAKRAIFPVGDMSAGVVVPGCRAQYPYYNWQLPVLQGQKPGEQIVKSAYHEREIMRGAWGKGEQRWERNAV